MKKIIGLILILSIIASCSYANFISYPLKKLDENIVNINEPIKSIWICLTDANCDIEEVLKDTNLIFDESADKYSIYPGTDKQCIVNFNDEVDLFTDEDYVFEDNYDKKNYIVTNSIYYSYDFENETGGTTGSGTSYKFKNMDELVKELGEEYKGQDITCTRTISYSAFKLIDEKEIPVSEIVDGVLNVTLDDFSKIDEVKTGYVIRFENENGEYKSIGLDTYDYHVDHEIDPGQDVRDGYRKVTVDYDTLNYVSEGELTEVQEPEKGIVEETSGSMDPVVTPSVRPADQPSTLNYLLIGCALAVLLVVVIVIMFISNNKKK